VADPVAVVADGPSDAAVLVLGHGAGAGLDSPFMAHMAAGIAARGFRVVRFNFPYIEAGRRSPDRGPVLEETFRGVVDEVRSGAPKVFVGGKSLGGRVASLVVADGLAVDGLVFFGYPLHPPGKPDRLRVDHWSRIGAPALFIEGSRDPFCPLDTLERELGVFGAPTALEVIEDGDHSYKVRASSGRTTADAWDEAVDAAARWMSER
jgi:uncharacterized protein